MQKLKEITKGLWNELTRSDRVLHWAVGFWLAILCAAAPLPEDHVIVIGLVVATVAGIGKEAYDKFVKGTTADIYDCTATILGAVSALPFTYLYYILVTKL